ncbi:MULTISPECIES: sensor histidine kinase [unclassified Corynebacterium]|uniref:sensor histidine kinase n=1 Tax=unclassified Corynebacterium TaxID=2624378 RepID=UPI0029C9F023|nr:MULTISPECIES: histidine kinase [unclassified Corynebacterium]WPF67316.1 histidine kinase [Corynebacterium sp. 22KM0430]WPF69807.1 histidine kinase [Corynebacterium sp. 21KM1197]
MVNLTPQGTHRISFILWIILCVLISSTFLHKSPQLGAANTRYHQEIFTAGLTLTFSTWIVTTILFSAKDYHGTATLSLSAAILLAYGYFPFLRHPWLYTGLLALANAIAWSLNPSPPEDHFPWIHMGISTILLLIGTGTTLSVRWSIRLMTEAERVADLQRHLILSEERLRFSQEIHDTLGQRLAAISIKTELVKNLALRNDPRLLPEITEIQQITRRAAAEVRSVVHGYSDIDLAAEIRSTQALLHSSRITLHTAGTPQDIPLENQDISAWFVRETTTNILKHARATTAWLSLSPAGITIRNDGVGDSSPSLQLSGLEALRRRAAKNNGTSLHVTKQKGEFHVKLIFTGEKQ